jgi:competence protein ComEC
LLLIYLSCAWIIGILLGVKFSIPAIWLAVSLLPLPFIFVFHRHKKLIVTITFLIFVVLSGIVRYQSSLPVIDENQIQFYNDQPSIELKGIISQAPDVRDKSTHIYLSAIEMKTPNGWKEVNGHALLFVARYPAYEYGDDLLINGKLETPQNFEDFDYQGYLANQGIYSTMLFPKIELLDTGKGYG